MEKQKGLSVLKEPLPWDYFKFSVIPVSNVAQVMLAKIISIIPTKAILQMYRCQLNSILLSKTGNCGK